MKDKMSTTPIPADLGLESGGAGAACILGGLDDDGISWPSDGEMSVLRVKAHGQSILCNGGNLCWPSATGPRVRRPIPPSSSTAVSPAVTGSLVNLAAPALDVAPDGEATLVPLTSWSVKSVNLSDNVPLPLSSTTISPHQLPVPSTQKENLKSVVLTNTESCPDEIPRPASPQSTFWRGIITKLCCGGGSDDRC